MAHDHKKYSKTSNNGPSEKRTTSVQRTDQMPPIDASIEIIHFKPPRSGYPLNSEQWTLMGPRRTLTNKKLRTVIITGFIILTLLLLLFKQCLQSENADYCMLVNEWVQLRS